MLFTPHCSVDSVPASPAFLPGASSLPQREAECGIILLWQITGGYRGHEQEQPVPHWAAGAVKNPLCLDWSTNSINSLQNNSFQQLREHLGAHWCTDREKGTSAGLSHAHLQIRVLISSRIYLIPGSWSRLWFEIPWGKRGGVHLAHKFQQWVRKCMFAMQISATSHLMTNIWHSLPWKSCVFHFWCSWPITMEESFRSSVLPH